MIVVAILALLSAILIPGIVAHKNYRKKSAELSKINKTSEPLNPLAQSIQNRDGTNFIGVFIGMIAEHDGQGNVTMASATSGEVLRWISYQEFIDVYINKIKPEYPK